MKANTTITLLGATLLALGAHAAPQAAQQHKPGSIEPGQMPGKHGDMRVPRTPEGRAKMANSMFDKIDTDKDGSLSRTEFVAHHKAMSMEHCMDEDHHGMGHPRSPAQGKHGGTAPKQAFADWDANKDGRLSKTEMAKHPMSAHFAMMDADKDGYLSPKEYASHGM